MSISSKLDELTDTFSFDKAYCDQLLSSEHAEQVTELLISQLWMNNSHLICIKSLVHDKGLPNFDEKSRELAKLWVLILSESFMSDMGLIVYLCIRGLPTEAGTALRRAFEHIGVLSHILKYPDKLKYVDKPDSSDYSYAFRRYAKNETKIGTTSKRFACLIASDIATTLYAKTSKYSVHGGTGTRLATSTIENTTFTCKFYKRPEMENKYLKDDLEILTQAHLLLCMEYMGLCLSYGFQSDELIDVFYFLKELLPTTGTRTPAMQECVDNWLQKLRS